MAAAGRPPAPAAGREAAEVPAAASAELLIGDTFDAATWRRPLCVQGLTAEGRRFVLSDDATKAFGAAGRCEGRLIATWAADESGGQPGEAHGGFGGPEPSPGPEPPSPALAAWRRLDPHLADPDGVVAAAEYFPLGPLSRHSRSFLRLRLRAADDLGDEVFVVRPEGAGDEPAPPAQLLRPATGWQRWLRLPAAVHEVCAAGAPRPLQLDGVCVLPEDGVAAALSLGDLRGLSAAAAVDGFLPGTPWQEQWRVRRVAEHCRAARLGLWGFVFRLKHSVLAVHLRREGRDEEVLYLDKNADIGVSWRRAGFREHFPEAPREGHGFDAADLRAQDLWSAVVSTPAFSELQEVSNCQHFVRESLAELAARGHLAAAGRFELRNQWIADVLRGWGHLDEDCKAQPGHEGVTRAWQTLLSWGCKAGVARLVCPWAEHFVLRPASPDE